MLSTPLPVFNCPTRRPLATYPTWQNGSGPNLGGSPGDVYQIYATGSASATPNVAKTDYAANGGDVYTSPGTNGDPWGTSNDEGGPLEHSKGRLPGAAYWWAVATASTGVVYPGNGASPAAVTDGLSNTYLFGEKYLDPDEYTNGQDGGDNENAYMGDNADVIRWGGQSFPSPMQDTPGNTQCYGFGNQRSREQRAVIRGVLRLARCG